MNSPTFRLETPSILTHKGKPALRRHCPGGLLRKLYLCNYEVSVYLSPTPPFPAPESVISLPPLDCLRFLRGRRPPPELRAGRQGARGYRRRRRPPHPHPGEASGRRALRETAPERAPQRQGPGLSQGGAAHPGRGPRRLRATALDPPPRAHRLARGGGREVAAAEARLVQGGPIPTSPSSSRPTTGASTRRCATSTPGSPTRGRPPRLAR